MESVQRLECKKLDLKAKYKYKMETGIIYMITNKVNNQKYIGQTSKTIEERWKRHIKDSKYKKHGCRLLKNAINEYGDTNFIIEILLICNKISLNTYEPIFIDKYGTLSPNGYNLQTGGLKNSRLCKETLNKMSESQKGIKKSDETKKKISDTLSGRKLNDENIRNTISISGKYRNMSIENKNILKKALDILNLDNLPMYITFGHDSKNKAEKITVRIPNKKIKTFAKKNMELTEKIKLAIDFLHQRESVLE